MNRRASIARALNRRGLGGLGEDASPPPDFNTRTWSDYQKVAAASLAKTAASAPSFLHQDLTLFLPPSDAKPFIVTPILFTAYPAAGAAAVVLLSYVAPQGAIAVINKLAIVHVGGNPPDGTGNVIWQVLVNGAGVKGMNNLTSQVGTYAAPNDTEILLMENDLIQVTVQVPAAGVPPPGTTAARFHGWTYPLSEAIMPLTQSESPWGH
jgi:hypothetical protein